MRFHVNSRPRFSFNGSKFMYFFVLRKYFHHVFVLNKRPFVYYYPKSTLVLYTDVTKNCAKRKADFRKEPLSRKANYALPP